MQIISSSTSRGLIRQYFTPEYGEKKGKMTHDVIASVTKPSHNKTISLVHLTFNSCQLAFLRRVRILKNEARGLLCEPLSHRRYLFTFTANLTRFDLIFVWCFICPDYEIREWQRRLDPSTHCPWRRPRM